MNKPSIVAFDDHPLILDSIKRLLESNDYRLVFSTSDSVLLLEQLPVFCPDILILDVMAEGVTGLELFKEVNKNFPEIKIIAHTSLSSPFFVEQLINLNVQGFVSKKQPAETLILAIQNVFSGSVYFPEDYAFLLSQNKTPIIQFTAREKEVLRLIAIGKITKEIASELNISINTVENHRSKLFKKLGVQNIAELLKKCNELGYV